MIHKNQVLLLKALQHDYLNNLFFTGSTQTRSLKQTFYASKVIKQDQLNQLSLLKATQTWSL